VNRHTIVKVCGITRVEDAAWALDCGADWIGFILAGKSPRRIAPEDAAEIVASARVGTGVAVLVDVTPAQALDIARRAQATRVQLHRVSPQSWPRDFPLPCTFAMGVTPEGEIRGEEPGEGHLLLLDTSLRDMAGGTGHVWPWSVARTIVARRDVMLAGGLSGDNVAEAIRELQPYGVDASSQLESAPGIKDPERVRNYILGARHADANARTPS
jgi:phosphoribosylanthranilate isomerase